MTKFILAAILLASSLASAAEIYCTRDDEVDDWSITGELGGSTVDFFDNDTNSKFIFSHTLESLPAKFVYVEESNPDNYIIIDDVQNGKKTTTAEYASMVESDEFTASVKFTCSID